MGCRSKVQIDWSSGEKSGQVSVNSHSLCLYASGPDRKPGEPVVVVIQGLTSSCKGWAAVQRLLKPVVRTYLYDRSGCGQSDESPQKPTSTAIALELDQLLKNADVGGPFILVAHSWGGILSREFFHLRGGDVAGLVLVDANQERTLEILDWRNPWMWAIVGALDYLEAIGAWREHKLTDAEWAIFVEDEGSPKHRKQAQAEMAEYQKGFPILAAKKQLHRDPPLLGERPVCLILGNTKRDYERLYVEGVKAGAGSEADRAAYRRLLETFHEKDRQLQLEALSLSRTSRVLVAEESGHNVQFTNPEVIVEGVKWVLSQFHS